LRKEVGRRTQGRLDRWIFDHRGSPPEELLEAQAELVKRPVYHSLEEAAEVLKAAKALEHSSVYLDDGEDGSGDVPDTAATEPLEEWRYVYDAGNPLKWSPQLGTHRKVSAIVDFWARELCDPPRIKAKPQPKPVYGPCKVKPTGRILHPIDTPYWMTPRDKYRYPFPTRADKPYDPDRREIVEVRLKGGKTKRVYRQMAANETQTKEESNVGPKRNQAPSRATAEIIVFEGRTSGLTRFYVSERRNQACLG
jgi:hypothetical protein